ncbi:MAG: hypothetical protein IKT06_02180 [Aeriscardovia sp.]|nr:hypothetical protein [Aeriscardovia sp.]
MDSTAEFEGFVSIQIDKYKDSEPDLWLKLMEKRRYYFPTSMLSPKGLILRHANETQYLDGHVLYEEADFGEVEPRFSPSRAGSSIRRQFPPGIERRILKRGASSGTISLFGFPRGRGRMAR